MIKELNDMVNAIAAWKLVDEISAKLVRRLHKQTVMELMFWTAIDNKQDPALIIRTLHEDIKANETGVADIIGNVLTNKIKSYVFTTTDNLLHGVPAGALQEVIS